MLKKTIEYTDYNDEPQVEDFYFNLSKADLIKMEMSEAGGFENLVQRIIKERDTKKLWFLFEELVLGSYGEKSPDGKEFVKNDALRTRFKQTDAYSELVTELATDADAASKFMNGLIPAKLRAEIEAMEKKAKADVKPKVSLADLQAGNQK